MADIFSFGSQFGIPGEGSSLAGGGTGHGGVDDDPELSSFGLVDEDPDDDATPLFTEREEEGSDDKYQPPGRTKSKGRKRKSTADHSSGRKQSRARK